MDALKAITEMASYFERIPEDIRDMFESFDLTDYEYQNEFLKMLGKIVRQIVETAIYDRDQNPFARFFREELPFGSTVEDNFVHLFEGAVPAWDDDGSVALSRVLPDITTLYHKINYEMQYKRTTSRAQMKTGFLSLAGFEEMANAILSTIHTSCEYDLYLQSLALIGKALSDGAFIEVEASAPEDDTSAKSFMKTIKSLTREFRQINESFNSAGVLTNTKSDDDIYILLKGKYKDNLDVDMLATAFNMDKLEIKHKVIVLPDNLEFDEDDEIIGFIIDGGFFRIWPTLFEDSLQANAAGLFTNNFLTTVWIFSYATFFNAVVLKKKNSA